MAQKTENEETEFKVPETLTLCVNNCGVTGNPATNNMCQKCFNASSSSPATSSSAPSSSNTTPSQHRRSRNEIKLEVVRRSEPGSSDPVKKAVNRCNGCKRKVGLTGFRCRCGELFCWEHRYSDRHDCSFDYKAAGREAIARENPVVKAAKIVRV